MYLSPPPSSSGKMHSEEHSETIANKNGKQLVLLKIKVRAMRRSMSLLHVPNEFIPPNERFYNNSGSDVE